MRQRDASDSTVVDFLNAAEGVTAVDTTHLNFDQSVDAVLAVIDERREEGRDGR
jgi:cytidylate kinase